MAVLTNNRLYIANVGDSRAVVAYEASDGSLQVKQLSKDHDVGNEQELERLVALGLDREQLKKSGRLGTQENTRSIGDYILKGGYKDMETLWYGVNYMHDFFIIATVCSFVLLPRLLYWGGDGGLCSRTVP